MPASRKEGLPLMFFIRLKEKTTSAEESGVPSENLTSWRRWRVNVLASLDPSWEERPQGSAFVTLLPLKVSSVSYIALTTMLPEISNSRPGSAVFMSNDLSTTRVLLADIWLPEVPQA